MKYYLYSDRIAIRPIYKTDIDSIYAYRSLEEVARYQYWMPFSKEQTIKFADQNRGMDLDVKDKWIGLAVVYRKTGLLIGDCSIRIKGGIAEIGCNISPEYQHKGLAKETISLLIDYSFQQADIEEVFGITDRENAASVKLMESLGMLRDPDFQEEIMCKGVLSIEHKYAIKKGMSDLIIRKPLSTDTQKICDIYNHYVANTAITFEVEPVTLSEMERRIKGIVNNGFPYFIGEVGNKVIGYYYINTWNKRKAYDSTAEITIYLDKDEKGKGYGSILFLHLLKHLDKNKYHVLLAGITIPNEGSIRLHEKFGFKKVSHMKEIGRKFDEWRDVGHWQLIL